LQKKLMSKRVQPESSPDQFQRYRDQAAQLEEALKTLAACETEIEQLRGELESTEASLQALHDAPTADFDKIDALSLRRNSISARLEHMAPRLLAVQHSVQDGLSRLVNDLNTVYLVMRNGLIARATDEICSLLHPSARGLQRMNAGFLAVFHQKVVEAAELSPSLHPLATSPLEDVPTRQWSLERETTMRICRGECRRVLESLPKLLAAAQGSSLPVPQAGEPIAA
jgi:hypothetical protein